MRHALYDPKISTKVYLFTVQTARERTTNDSLYTKTKTLEINYLKIGNFSPRIFSGVVCVVCVGYVFRLFIVIVSFSRRGWAGFYGLEERN